jgi:hypothetical protein
MSQIRTNSIVPLNGLPSGASGGILQIVQTIKTDSWTASPGANNFTAVTGFTASITPSSTTSKILVMVNAIVGYQSYQVKGLLKRNGTSIGLGDAAGSRPRVSSYVNSYAGTSTNDQYHMLQMAINLLDSPSTTSACTYTLELGCYSTFAVYMNRSHAWQNTSDFDGAPASTITLMEVSG